MVLHIYFDKEITGETNMKVLYGKIHAKMKINGI